MTRAKSETAEAEEGEKIIERGRKEAWLCMYRIKYIN